MKTRALGRTGITVSEIGMGLEQLLDKDEQVIADTIRAAIDGGVTYFDCHPGHDINEKDIDYAGYAKLGKAIQGYRDKLVLSFLALASVRNPADVEPRFTSWLNALNTGHTDVFIIQFCDKPDDYAQVAGEGGVLEYAKRLKADGKVRAIGLSTHSADVMRKAIANGAFDVLMLPVNPAFDVITDGDLYKTEEISSLWDAAHDFAANGKTGAQPRKSIYAECERNGVAVVGMKPFAGGFIFGVEKDAGFTAVNLTAYALAQNGVSTVIPGCTCPEEIRDILRYYTCTEKERDYSGAVAKSRWSVAENCLYCNHCLPCAADINIGQVNRLLDAVLLETGADVNSVREAYGALQAKASDCIECGACEDRCPFKVRVIERMRRAVEEFERSPNT